MDAKFYEDCLLLEQLLSEAEEKLSDNAAHYRKSE